MPNTPVKTEASPSLSLVCVLFATLSILIYANTLNAPFIFDDFHSITENSAVKIADLSPTSLINAATQSHAKYRWLPNLSLALNYYGHGSNVLGYHLVNILIHCLTGIAAYLLFLASMRLLPGADPLPKGEIALLAALLWLAHPLQTNAVTYIVQRMTSMMTLFYLLSLLCYVKGRTEKESTGKRNAFFISSLICGIMALFSKENAAMLPVLILAYEYFFIPTDRHKKRIYAISIATIALLGLTLGWLFLGSHPLENILSGYRNRTFTLSERLLTEPRVIFTYLSLLILPLPSRLNINHDYTISHTLLTPPQTIFALAGLAGLLFLICFFYKKEHRLLSFSLLWFLANLLIESTVIPLELLFEHRLYLPTIFLFVAAVSSLYTLTRSHRAVGRAVVAVTILLLCVLTWQRNATWASASSLWGDVVRKSPQLARGHVNLGRAFIAEKRFSEAEQQLRTGMAIEPEDSRAYHDMAALYYHQKRYQESLTTARQAMTKKHADLPAIHLLMANTYLKMKNIPQALAEIDRAITLSPDSADAYETKGIAYSLIGQQNKAEQLLRKAIAIDPHPGHAYLNLGIIYDRQHRFPEAIAAIETALDKGNTDQARAHNNLGIIYWEIKEFEKSIRHAETAINIDPDLLDAYITLGITFEDMGQKEKAFASYQTAWRKGFDMISLYNNWAEKHLADNMPGRAMPYLREAQKLSPIDPRTLKNIARAAALPAK